jgi:hypothetical protein
MKTVLNILKITGRSIAMMIVILATICLWLTVVVLVGYGIGQLILGL